MSKAINWPERFKNEIINEDTSSPKIALRLGSIYHDKNYFHLDDVVDIRVGNLVVRKAQILDDTYVTTITELEDELLPFFKKELDTKEKIVDFLSQTYNQQVTTDSQITVIAYVNRPITQDFENDDPHMS